MSAARNSAATVQREAHKAKWPDSVKTEIALLYFDVKEAANHLADDYNNMILLNTTGKSKEQLQALLTTLQDANNKMVVYFRANYKHYGSASSVGVTTEIIDLVFSGLTKLWDWVAKIKKDKKEAYIKMVNDQRITADFDGTTAEASKSPKAADPGGSIQGSKAKDTATQQKADTADKAKKTRGN
ncbi:MAG: hypothetical protein J7623_31440 [Chitinophaga sp.]|uniref:hypothetical protein n=1 Tax=Chitinophaga sp. TaxID=1869181 RepID=UPI001B27D052|nr:hypothetical protein [Chitinophaga sp.]MBO9733198.1 hypothetical protein [Chitinophaga sp.]